MASAPTNSSKGKSFAVSIKKKNCPKNPKVDPHYTKIFKHGYATLIHPFRLTKLELGKGKLVITFARSPPISYLLTTVL